MKCRVIVTLKKSVFDPQGSAIERSLRSVGLSQVQAVRQGKIFDLELSPELSPEDALPLVNKVAKDVLSNPVLEEFHVEFL